ncbi:MAG: hypothetical protein PUD59_01840 [bacterium]|nr:hypothetical protein [bacterium]
MAHIVSFFNKAAQGVAYFSFGPGLMLGFAGCFDYTVTEKEMQQLLNK